MKPPHVKPTFITDQIRGLLDLPTAEIAAKLRCCPKYVQQLKRRGCTQAHSGPWNDERVERLKKLWASGVSASAIASQLGGVTRNAVIGKVARLGLAPRKTACRIAAPRPRKRVLLSPAAQVIKAIKKDGLPLPTPAETDIPRVALNDLDRHHCRWVCSDAGHPIYDPRYCGEKIVPTKSYCLHHLARSMNLPNLSRPSQPFRLRSLEVA
jgi:GcrA cell cycle regulator